jgi:hypothetical protein
MLSLLAALALLQDPEDKPYQPKHKLEFKLTLEKNDGSWQFVVEGTSDLPDDVNLRARVYALEEVDDFRGGKRLDEEVVSTKLDRNYHDFTLKGGKFREVAYECKRTPYSLRYRAKVFYLMDEQQDEIARRVLDKKDFSAHADIRRGTDADFDRELKETLKELSGELEVVNKLYKEFKAEFLAQQKKWDEKAWTKWTKDWLARIQDVRDRNEERWLLWAVWLERQGKFRIEGFCDRFLQLAQEAPEALKGDKDTLERLQLSLQNFLLAFDETREVIGIEAPFDPEAVGTQLAPYAEVVARIRAIVGKSDRDAWSKEGETLRTRAREALLTLSTQKLLPRRGYERILAISQLFLELHPLADRLLAGKPGPDDAARLAQVLKDHDRKLVEFREYAGLK